MIPIEELTQFIPDLMKQLPQYYRNNNVMLQIQTAIAKQIGIKEYTKDDIHKQFSVDTATWGLDIYERELRLETDQTKSYQHRREIIKAKISGSGSTTKAFVKSIAATFSGGEVDVIEYPPEYRFEVKFVGTLGIPSNMTGFIAMLEEIKPAYESYTFIYTYTTWDSVKTLTWDQVKLKTWDELKVYEGV